VFVSGGEKQYLCDFWYLSILVSVKGDAIYRYDGLVARLSSLFNGTSLL
jgi:hypothetical protein